jgi:hypothetical protein
MKRIIHLFSFLMILSLVACDKDETAGPDQLPVWLKQKITELVPDQKLCEITTVTIIEFHGKRYYHVYCGIWSCMYCHLFDEKGNHPEWDNEEWSDFRANKKEIKVVPACS